MHKSLQGHAVITLFKEYIYIFFFSPSTTHVVTTSPQARAELSLSGVYRILVCPLINIHRPYTRLPPAAGGCRKVLRTQDDYFPDCGVNVRSVRLSLCDT